MWESGGFKSVRRMELAENALMFSPVGACPFAVSPDGSTVVSVIVAPESTAVGARYVRVPTHDASQLVSLKTSVRALRS